MKIILETKHYSLSVHCKECINQPSVNTKQTDKTYTFIANNLCESLIGDIVMYNYKRACNEQELVIIMFSNNSKEDTEH